MAALVYQNMVKAAQDKDEQKRRMASVNKVNGLLALYVGSSIGDPKMASTENVIQEQIKPLAQLRDTYPNMIPLVISYFALREEPYRTLSKKQRNEVVWRHLSALTLLRHDFTKLSDPQARRFLSALEQYRNRTVPESKQHLREYLRLDREVENQFVYFSELNPTELCDPIVSMWSDLDAKTQFGLSKQEISRSLAQTTSPECANLPRIVPPPVN